jgi:SulP family sulfate permease
VTGAVRLVDPDQWRSLARSDRAEVVIAAITALAVINLGVLVPLVAAVVLSLLDVIRRIARPNDAVLGWSPAELRYADVSSDPDVAVTPGVVVYRFSDRLFFANVHFFKRRVWAAVDAAPKPTRHIVFDLAGVPGMDSSAAAGRGNYTTACWNATSVCRSHGLLTRWKRRWTLGLVELIGTDHFHGTVTSAVESVARHDPRG